MHLGGGECSRTQVAPKGRRRDGNPADRFAPIVYERTDILHRYHRALTARRGRVRGAFANPM